jgi:hypothetical protein
MLIKATNGSFRQFTTVPMSELVSKVTVSKMSAHAARFINNNNINAKVVRKTK